jgi:peptide deformylase
MRRPIIIFPDDLLLSQSKVIADWKYGHGELVGDMIETLQATKGVGLAAVQVGIPIRLFVMWMPDGKIEYFANPVIVQKEGDAVVMDEGCLSIPGVKGKVPRYQSLTLAYNTAEFFETGKVEVMEFKGIYAQCIQHELDHLDGKLVYDTSDERTQRRMARKCDKYKREGYITPPHAIDWTDRQVYYFMHPPQGLVE